MRLSSNPSFHRLAMITGHDALSRLCAAKVIIFGLGGVGSWCAEALVRSGVHHLTIVDSDVVCVTNINRQVQAVAETVGKSKTAEMMVRLHAINPDATITPRQSIFDKTTAATFDLSGYDYVIDAIDSLSCKVELIMHASNAGAKIYSALGAANKLDPSKIKVSSLWDSYQCRLGYLVRKRLRRRGFNGEVTCVFSDEIREMKERSSACGTAACMCPKTSKAADGSHLPAHEWCSTKKQINGSAVHVTGTFGFFLAGLVVQDIMKQDGTPLEKETP